MLITDSVVRFERWNQEESKILQFINFGLIALYHSSAQGRIWGM